jgi:hypothetical protein
MVVCNISQRSWEYLNMTSFTSTPVSQLDTSLNYAIDCSPEVFILQCLVCQEPTQTTISQPWLPPGALLACLLPTATRPPSINSPLPPYVPRVETSITLFRQIRLLSPTDLLAFARALSFAHSAILANFSSGVWSVGPSTSPWGQSSLR